MARRQALRELLRLKQHTQTLSAKYVCGTVGRSPKQYLLPNAFLPEEIQQSKTCNNGAAWMFAAAGAGVLCSSSTAFAGGYVSTEAATEVAPQGTASKNRLPSLNTPTKSRVVFVLGGPGSGKGTQCTKIVDEFGFVHLSAGDLLREEINSGSDNGNMIKGMIKEGKIVPAEVTVKLLQKAMEKSSQDKFLIDGFPRNEENRLCFEEVTGIQPEFILFFECPEEVMEKRLLGRNQGRIDDNIETIRKRFRTFVELSLPVVDHYEQEGKVRKINATKAPDDVFKTLSPLFLRFLQEDLVEASHRLVAAIDGGDYGAYARLCDPGLTAFEPEAQGQLVEGMDFHKFYFDFLHSQSIDASSPPPLSTLASPQTVILGDVGVVTYTRLKQKVGTPLEGFVDSSNETRVWHRRKMEGGGYEWKHIHFHRSKAPTK